MGVNFGILELVNWVSYLFPTLADFLKTLVPLLFCGISIIGVFSNILPEPGTAYPVPTLADIAIELKQRSRIVYWLTCISRQLAVGINKLIQSRYYRWFHAWTNLCSRLISHFKGGGGKHKFTKLSDPEPYRPDWKQLTDDGDK